jgi:hypothetical protein
MSFMGDLVFLSRAGLDLLARRELPLLAGRLT